MARFTLRQIALFVFACCVYLAVVRNFFVENEFTTQRIAVVTDVIAWLVLFAFYWYWRLIVAIAVQLGFLFWIGLSFTFGERVEIPMRGMIFLIDDFGTAILLVIAIGTIISFPIAVVTLSFRGLRKR